MSKERTPEIEKNKFILEQLSEAEQDILIEEAREKKRRDESARLKSAIRIGEKQGRVEGRAEGEKEKSIKIAKNLIKDNIPIKKIEEYTGLTKSEIEKLI